jgi:RHS repeat-associated protein
VDVWGYQMDSRKFASSLSQYKFTSKERDMESDYDYFGARYYDSRIGRWGGVDVKYDNNISMTPYQYARLNPVMYFDPNGKEEIKIYIKTFIHTDYAHSPMGTFTGSNRDYDFSSHSYKTFQMITIQTDQNLSKNGNSIVSDNFALGQTMKVAPEYGLAFGPSEHSAIGGYYTEGDKSVSFAKIHAKGTLPYNHWTGISAPPVEYSVNIGVTLNADGSLDYSFSGDRSSYPAIEMYIEREDGSVTMVYGRKPTDDPWQLFTHEDIPQAPAGKALSN